jgi:protein DGCR14
MERQLAKAKTQYVPQQRPPKALEEDEYIQGLSTIIKRDFFPDLDRLESQDTPDAILEMTANHSLDTYQLKYTSEDNESFQKILERQNMVNRDKNKLLYKGEEKLLIENSSVSDSIETWKFKTKNAFFYGAQAPLTVADLPKSRSTEGKIIKHHATRLSDEFKEKELGHRWTEAPIQPPQYPMVEMTPTPVPNIDVNPKELLTWGKIQTAPILVSEDGPKFSMQATPRREVVSNKLADKVRKMQAKSFKTPTLVRGNLTPLHRLMSKGADSQLRQSYSPRVSAYETTPRKK